MRLNSALSILSASFVLAGCSGAGGGIAGGGSAPKLINYSVKQKRDMEQAGSYMGAAVDAVQSIPIQGQAGDTFVSNQDCMWNEGKPFDGLKVVVSGDAFTQGFLGPASKCDVEVRDQAGDAVTASSSVPFALTGAGQYTATFPSVHCTNVISYTWTATALRNGVSTCEALAGPLDGTCPPVSFKRGCAIMARYVAQPVQVDATASTNSTGTSTSTADSTPKNQLELGEQQSANERVDRLLKSDQ